MRASSLRNLGLSSVLIVVSVACGDDAAQSGAGAAGSGAGGPGSPSASTGAGPSATGATVGVGGGVAGPGIAAAYPGDVGIGSHPSVLFFEDFEDADTAALVAGFDSASDPSRFTLTGDVPPGAAAGSQSARASATGAEGITLFKTLPTQQGSVFTRYYVKYEDPTFYHHTGMWLGGFNPPSQWPQGTAGIRPNGADFFHTGFEPMNGTLGLDHYAQWPSMDCFMEPGGCWGNVFNRGAEPVVPSAAWSCVELLMKMNTPGSSDGELAVWIGGALVQHLLPGSPSFNRLGNGVWEPDPGGTPFPGFDWRSTPDLGMNFIWLNFYVDDAPSAMSWDQVVVATERVGCLAGG